MEIALYSYLYGMYGEDINDPPQKRRVIVYGGISPDNTTPLGWLEGFFVTSLDHEEMFGTRKGERGAGNDDSVMRRSDMKSFEKEHRGRFIPFRLPPETAMQTAHRVNNGSDKR